MKTNKKLSAVDTAKIQILYNTGAIKQTQLAKVFKISQSRVNAIVTQTSKKRG